MSWNNFNAPNLGLLVYKRLYSETNIFNHVQVIHDQHEDKLEINFPDSAKPFEPFYQTIYEKTLAGYCQIENSIAKQRFTLFTTYPGLTLGAGYTHDSSAKGDIKIGFYFDHTTGQPVIPGSSIKGVLKSVFENEEDITDKNSVHNIRFFIEEILKECKENEKSEWQNLLNIINNENIELLTKLKEDVFGNQDNEGKDIFFDAVIDFTKTGTNKTFLVNDFITPHPDPLKNPKPLMFLKVCPNIAFEFRFLLVESEINSTNRFIKLSEGNKEKLFQKILLTIGIGAKTNVGYGQFDDGNQVKNKGNESTDDIDRKIEDELKIIIEKRAETEKNKTEAEKRLIKGANIECSVIAKDKNYYTFGVDWDKNLKFQKKIDRIKTDLIPGDKIVITIIEDYFIRQEISFLNDITKI